MKAVNLQRWFNSKRGVIVTQMLLVLFIFSDACVEPLSIDIPKISPRLVVDGLITNEPGPYEIDLFYTTSIDSTLKRPKYETGAIVFIVDDLGHEEPLYETEPGKYRTSESSIFQGEVGRSYHVRFITSKGKEYNSAPQEMMPAGEIDGLELGFVDDVVPSGNPNEPEPFDGLRLLVNARGVADNPNLFRWRWVGTYKTKSFPELVKEGGRNGPIPAPLECSGYIRVGNHIQKVGECTCCICWATEYSSGAVVSDNRIVNEYTFNEVPIGLISVTSLHFFEKYHVEVQQLSVSPVVYEFWKLAGIQQGSGGNIFQPNAVKIRGNIRCVSDPDEEVLGIFSVSAIVKKSMFITPDQIPAPLPPLEMIAADCRQFFQNSTTTQPVFW